MGKRLQSSLIASDVISMITVGSVSCIVMYGPCGSEMLRLTELTTGFTSEYILENPFLIDGVLRYGVYLAMILIDFMLMSTGLTLGMIYHGGIPCLRGG